MMGFAIPYWNLHPQQRRYDRPNGSPTPLIVHVGVCVALFFTAIAMVVVDDRQGKTKGITPQERLRFIRYESLCFAIVFFALAVYNIVHVVLTYRRTQSKEG